MKTLPIFFTLDGEAVMKLKISYESGEKPMEKFLQFIRDNEDKLGDYDMVLERDN